MARRTSRNKAAGAAVRRLRDLSPRQLAVVLVLAVVFIGVCFVLENTGVMGRLLDAAGVTRTDALPADGVLEAHFLDVGNADAIFVTCNGKTLLIDAGERTSADTVTQYLSKRGVKKLDYVIATHADSDHIGGMKTVIERFQIGEFLMAFMPDGAEPTTSTYLNMLIALDEKGVSVTDVRPNTQYSFGEARITILGPVAESDDKNEQSVVCRISHGANRLLFMGDAGKEEEDTLLAAGVDLRADLLKVGHHGSKYSSTDEFLAAVNAEFCVISCGADNDYGHPHEDALARLQKHGATVFRTDQNGTVVVTSDGKSLAITAEDGGDAK